MKVRIWLNFHGICHTVTAEAIFNWIAIGIGKFFEYERGIDREPIEFEYECDFQCQCYSSGHSVLFIGDLLRLFYFSWWPLHLANTIRGPTFNRILLLFFNWVNARLAMRCDFYNRDEEWFCVLSSIVCLYWLIFFLVFLFVRFLGNSTTKRIWLPSRIVAISLKFLGLRDGIVQVSRYDSVGMG